MLSKHAQSFSYWIHTFPPLHTFFKFNIKSNISRLLYQQVRYARKKTQMSFLSTLLPGYHTCFFSHIPTISLAPGYRACFFLSHTLYISLVWVSRLLFLPHTHYISRAWVSRLLFLSHTLYISLLSGYHACFFSHVSTVLNPATFVPECCSKCRCK